MKMVLRFINITTGRANNGSSGGNGGSSSSGTGGSGSGSGSGSSSGVDGLDLNPLSRTEIQQYYHMLSKLSSTPQQHHPQQQQQQQQQQQPLHAPSKLTVITASELMTVKEGEPLVALMRQSD